MTSPVLSRRWYSRGNVVLPDTSTTTNMSKSLLWCVKAALQNQLTTGSVNSTDGSAYTRPSTSIWTHVASSDGIGGYSTSTDLFGGGTTFDATKVITTSAEGTNHSWICLRTNVSATGWQNPIWILINCVGTDYARARVLFSTTAFTGGSATTAPTATESWPACGILDGQSMTGVYIGDTASVSVNQLHFVCDSDGMFFVATNLSGDTVLGRFQFFWMCVDAVETNTNDVRKCVTSLANSRSLTNYNGNTWESVSTSLGGRTWNNSGAKAKYTNGANLHSGGGLSSWAFGGYGANSGVTGTGLPVATAHNWLSSTNGVIAVISTYVAGLYGINAFGSSVVDPSSSTFVALPAYMMDVLQVSGYTAVWRGRIPDFYFTSQGISSFSYPATTAPTMHVIGNVLIPLSVVPIT